MRQAITIISLLGSFTVFALTINLFDSLFMFILFGVVPGRTEPIPASQMLTIYGATAAIVLLFAVRNQLVALAGLLRFTLPRRSNAS